MFVWMECLFLQKKFSWWKTHSLFLQIPRIGWQVSFNSKLLPPHDWKSVLDYQISSFGRALVDLLWVLELIRICSSLWVYSWLKWNSRTFSSFFTRISRNLTKRRRYAFCVSGLNSEAESRPNLRDAAVVGSRPQRDIKPFQIAC